MEGFITVIRYERVKDYLSPVLEYIPVSKIDKLVQYKYTGNEESDLKREEVFKTDHHTFDHNQDIMLCLTTDGKSYRVYKDFISREILDKYLVVEEV